MRIIAGEFRGRRIAPPEGQGTRPMLDRVREALFSTLGEWIEGARVLDLCAGTGSLGLEALSRGAARVRFVERDGRALAILRRNVAALGVEERAEVVRGDALDPRSWSPGGADLAGLADLALLDPPYPLFRELRGRRRILGAVAALVGEVLAPGGVLVLHAHPRDLRPEDLPPGARVREYGHTALWYVEVPAGPADGEAADGEAAGGEAAGGEAAGGEAAGGGAAGGGAEEA